MRELRNVEVPHENKNNRKIILQKNKIHKFQSSIRNRFKDWLSNYLLIMEMESRCDVKQSESLIKAISKDNVHFICSAQVSPI